MTYSGPESLGFWDRIGSVKDDLARMSLYAAGCRLQELEQGVLEQLRLAETGPVP